MPYAWQIAGDAIADLRDLPLGLQEDVLDVLERVSANPSSLRADVNGYAIHDFERVDDESSHVIFLTLHRDDTSSVLSVLGIASHSRLRPSEPDQP